MSSRAIPGRVVPGSSRQEPAALTPNKQPGSHRHIPGQPVATAGAEALPVYPRPAAGRRRWGAPGAGLGGHPLSAWLGGAAPGDPRSQPGSGTAQVLPPAPPRLPLLGSVPPPSPRPPHVQAPPLSHHVGCGVSSWGPPRGTICLLQHSHALPGWGPAPRCSDAGRGAAPAGGPGFILGPGGGRLMAGGGCPMCALHPPKSARGGHGWLCPRVAEWGWGGQGAGLASGPCVRGGWGWAGQRGPPPGASHRAAP